MVSGGVRIFRAVARVGAGALIAGMLCAAPAQARARLVPAPRSVNLADAGAAGAAHTAGPAGPLAGRTGTAPQTLTVGSCNGPGGYPSIQSALAASANGDTVSVCPGTYTENLTVSTSVTLTGAGPGPTIVEPAVSDPNCGGGGGGSLCSGASNVILVQADGVTIEDLTLDGDNPSLTSGIVANGADIDARNGIITNHLMRTYNNLTVDNVTVRNMYLRGIYASSGGTFSFDNNTVTNVAADASSVAMFNFGGSGDMSHNTVSLANDAISANHSSGTTFLDNTISGSGSGVHSDNAGDGGGTADVIQGNTVTSCMTGGYGVWDFVPYIAPTFTGNSVTGCAVGLGSFGSGAPVSTAFTNNSVDGTGASVSSGAPIGVYVSTTEFGFGDSNVSATFQDATITHVAGDGVFVEQTTNAVTPTVTVNFSRIAGNGAGLVNNSTSTVTATDNWWGCNAGPNGTGCDTVSGTGTSTTSPWLVLKIGSAPGRTFDTTIVTADLTHDNGGADTSGSGNLPDGTMISFATTAGSLNHASAPTVSGKASVVLSASGQHGLATVTASLDHGSASTTVQLVRPSITINSVVETDGSSGTKPMVFTVRLNKASDTTVTAHYQTVDGTATSSASGFANPDYNAASGTVTFAPGVTSQPITVTIHGYPYNEAREQFTVVLSAPSPNAVIQPGAGVGTGYITNDDPVPSVSVTKAVTVAAGHTAVFSVKLSKASDQTVTVHYGTANGTAIAPGDYTAASGTVTFAPGVTSMTISVSTKLDAHPDPAETFSVKISSPTNATLGGTVKGTATISAH